jgi:hypothetical protein
MESEMSNMKLEDQLGLLQAEIAELERKEKALKDALKARGAGAYEGDLFRVNVIVAERAVFDAKAAKQKLLDEGFHVFVKKHTKMITVETVKAVAKNAVNLAA